MGEKTKEHLKNLLESFDTAMLITRYDDREHARPMAVAGVEGATTLWFVTHDEAPKSEEIRKDPRVSATFQSGSRFVALSGVATLVTDRAKVHELWRTAWKAWFPNGKDDPSLRLIRVDVTDAEFWDNAGTKGIRYFFEAAKAIVEHRRAETVESQHGRVKSVETNGPASQSGRS
jgi:general stress protein 26